MSSGLRFSSTFVLAFFFAGAAHAETPSDQSLAEALFQEGRKQMEEKRYGEACPKFAESQRLDPGLGTLLNLASCHELEGKTASAWAEFTQALGLATRESRASAQQLARTHIDAITPKLPKIVIAVAAENELPGLDVRLDGRSLGKPAWGIAAPIDPGSHTILVAAPGKKAWSSDIVLAPAEAKTVSIPLLEPEPAAPPAPSSRISSASSPAASEGSALSVPPSSAPAVDERSNQIQRMAGLIIGGVGVAAMGTGVVLGLAAKSTYNESSDWCDADGGCEAQGLELRDSAVRRGNVATVVFGIGTLATIGGATLWLLSAKSASPRAGAASVGLAAFGASAGGLVVRGTW